MSKPKSIRNQNIVKLKDKGMTLTEIAEQYNITKQTAHEIYHREKSKELSTEGA